MRDVLALKHDAAGCRLEHPQDFAQLVVFAWIAVISGVLVPRYSRVSAPAAVAVPAA